MPRWSKKTLKLQPDHGWEARPGYKIFVADRGAVRFDFPESWAIEPGERSIKFHDRTPPDDECTLEVTVFYLADGVDWSGLPLRVLLEQVVAGDGERSGLEYETRGEIVETRRGRVEVAWVQTEFVDEDQGRRARSRTCLARWSNIQPLITFSYWVDDAPRSEPIWADVIDSLVLGDYVEDPTRRLRD
ncbi:MAG TPA: hypothetical protein VG406_19405 [Isosphaeraceae bacterium]|jgi:hypothetical protein|nr:hypothetical protein [Isosphaeraceae bacterium]